MTAYKIYPPNAPVFTDISNHMGTQTLRNVYLWTHTPTAMKLSMGSKHKCMLSWAVVGRWMKKVKGNKRHKLSLIK